MKSQYVLNISRFELKKMIEKECYALLPVGACEQHGPHLPIGTDNLLASYYADQLAKRIECAVFPNVNFGYSWVWKGLPGTLTLEQETYQQMIFELCESIIDQGFKKIIIVNGHDSNNKALRYILRKIKDKYPNIFAIAVFYPNINEIYAKYMETKKWNGLFHADEWETSLMLASHPDLVDMSKAIVSYPEKPGFYGFDSSSLANISESGIYGDPTRATVEKGKSIINDSVDYLVNILKNNESEIKNDK